MSQIFHWESDPSLSQIERIIALLSDKNDFDPISSYQIVLSGNIVRFHYEVEVFRPSAINEIFTLIEAIRYYPIVFSVERPIDERNLNRLRQTLIELWSDSIEYLDDTVVTMFSDRIDIAFVDSDAEMIYVPQTQVAKIISMYPLNIIKNLYFATKSPLIEYAINATNGLNINAAKAYDFITINGATFISIPSNIAGNDFDLANNISMVIDGYENDGYYALPKEDNLTVEVAEMFNIPYVEFEKTRVFQSTKYIDQNAMINSLIEISNDKLPYLKIAPLWMMNADATIENRARLAAALIIAYIEIGNPHLLTLIPYLKSDPDLTVSGYFSSSDEADKFTSSLNRLLDNSGSWAIRPVSEPLEAAKVRYFVNVILKKPIKSIAVYVDEKLYIVFISDSKTDITNLVSNHPSTSDLSTLPAPSLSESDLTRDLREELGSQRADPVSGTPVGELNLDQLLSSIRIKDDNTDAIFTSETLSQMTRLFHPLTNLPFNDDVRVFMALGDLGLRGLYPIGPIPGLLSEMPHPPQQNPTFKDLISNNGFIDLAIGETLTELPISTDKLEEAQRIWDSGVLLSLWSKSRLFYGKEMSKEVPLSRVDEYLTK